MRTESRIGSRRRLVAVLAWLVLLGSTLTLEVLGQAETPAGAGTRKVTLKSNKDPAAKTGSSLSRAAKDGSPGSLKPSTGAGAAGAGAKSPPDSAAVAKNPSPGATPAAADADGETQGSFADRLVGFIRSYAAWILGGLGLLLAGALAWAFLGSRGKAGSGESAFAALGLGEKPAKSSSSSKPTKFSSTKIQAADVNNRLSRSVKTTEVETEREYALVVDEESLKMPPLPPESEERQGHRSGAHSASRLGDTGSLQKLLDEKDFKGAFEEYLRQIESNAAASFQGDVEKTLGEELLRAREMEKAVLVLEHHVATRSRKEVEPEVFFNLGYLHFLNRTLTKSKRYLTYFVETEKNPAYIARAKKILEKIKSSPAQN